MGDIVRRNKNLRRPRKTGAAKKRRQKLHRKRLVALGVSEKKVNAMNPKQVRTLLKYPAKLKAKK